MKPTSFHRRTGAFNLVELLIVIVVLALIGVFILPVVMPGRPRSKRINCTNNLKQVGLAFRLWSGDNNDKYPMQVSVTNGGTMELVASGIVFPHFQVMSNELSTPKILRCPADTNRPFATNFTDDFDNSKVSYFVGLDANETRTEMLLSGDRNLTTNGVAVKRGLVTLTTNSLAGWTSQIHSNQGNICLADGSVQQLTSAKLRAALQNSGAATNRLVFP
jgi:prepilin-type processing-associated H-X9-DG protein